MESQGLVPVEIDSFIQESDFGALGGKDCYMFCQADTCVSFKLGTDACLDSEVFDTSPSP